MCRYLLLSTSCLALVFATPTAAQIADHCEVAAFQQSYIDVTPLAYWDADHTYVADTFQGAQEGQDKQIRISGDTLIVNEDNFTSLARVAGQEITGVDQIVFDGRRVLLNMPIRLGDASISIHAEEVAFGPSGSISIATPPSNKDQVVEIVARRLDLSDAKPVFLNFATRHWTTPMAGSSWPTPEGAKRLIRISAEDVIPETTASDLDRELLEKAPARYVYRRTLDRSQGAGLGGGSGPDMLWAQGYNVNSGVSEPYDRLLADDLLWPLRTAEKLDRMFVRGPYDPAVRRFLTAQIEHFRRYFLAHDRPSIAAKLDTIHAKIGGELDTFGLDKFDVPMTDLQLLIDDFERDIETLLGKSGRSGLLADWDQQLIVSLASGTVDAGLIATAKTSLRDLRDAQHAASLAIDGIMSELSTVSQEMAITAEQAAEITEDLHADWIEHQEDLQGIGQAVEGVKFVGVAASAFFPAAAPVILGSTQALSTTGAGVLAHNSGEELGFEEIMGLLKEGAKEYQDRKKAADALAENWQAVKTSWDSVAAGFSPAWDQLLEGEFSGDELKAFMESGKSFKGNADKFLEGLKLPSSEQTVRIPKFAENDGRLKGLRARIAGLKTRESELKQALATRMEELQTTRATLLERVLVVDELQKLDFTNDVDLMRMRELATDLRRSFLSGLARSAALLQRGVVYHTGRWIDVNEGILTFAGDQVMKLASDIDTAEPEQLEGDLATWRSEAWGNYASLAYAAENAIEEWSAQQGGATPTTYTYTADLNSMSSSSYWEEGRNFLASVNGYLAELHAAPDAQTHTEIAGRAIRIPWEFTRAPNFDGPEFLLGVVTTLVEFDPPESLSSGRQVQLFVHHPRYGRVFYSAGSDDCARAGDYAANGQTYAFSASAPVDEEIVGNELTALQIIDVFTELKNRSYPLRTTYYMTVDLPEPGAWEEPPVITKMNVSFVGLRKQ